ncbi:hypothetical protein [Polaromonas sp.]|uniref:hypothetical protein n=1 Tax=Polaromonas sp. TaxID=1869339 RepID=UPI00352ABC52
MSAAIVNAFIWWAGALVWLGGFMFATAALCFACYRLCELSFRNLLRATRASTARYWIGRMEEEGLGAAQTEYRRLVAERKPNCPRDFINLEGELEREESAQRSQAQQKGPAS